MRVLFFGILKDLAGTSSATVEMPQGALLRDLMAVCEARFPKIEGSVPSLACAINQEYSEPDSSLKDDDEVALLPPVSGGSEDAPTDAADRPSATFLVKLVRERIVPHEIIPAMERPEDGAVVVFDGIVRNHSRNRKTLYLEYEAYEAMALAKLRELAGEATNHFAIRNVALVHRLGHLEIGESSVLIAVFSAHRAPAFEACRWLIDTLKRTVPIWKKEHFEDGAVWADGEPFSSEIPRANSSLPGSPSPGPASK